MNTKHELCLDPFTKMNLEGKHILHCLAVPTRNLLGGVEQGTCLRRDLKQAVEQTSPTLGF